MVANSVVVAGIPIPSSSPVFLAGVAVHVGFGLVCVVSGAVAMLSPKRPGRHPLWGRLYAISMLGLVMTAGGLAALRWAEDRVLFLLAVVAALSALFGWSARRWRRPGWAVRHITGMGVSYIVMLTAFYVDNGPNLPIWRMAPTAAYWLAPATVGLPILIATLRRHPLVRRSADG